MTDNPRISVTDPYHSPAYQQARPIVLARAGGVCEWPGCDRPATTVDHIIPLAHGGTHHLANLRASCRRCNSQGGAKIMNEVLAARRVGRRSRRW